MKRLIAPLLPALLLAGCAQPAGDASAWQPYELAVSYSEANPPSTLQDLSSRAEVAVRGKIVKAEPGPTYGEGRSAQKTVIITIEPTEVDGDLMGHPLTVEWGLWVEGVELTQVPEGEYLFFLERAEGYDDWLCVSAGLCPLGVDGGQVTTPREPGRVAELAEAPPQVADVAELFDVLTQS